MLIVGKSSNGGSMKFIIFVILFSVMASATETKTECPWIKQMERRTNPKANLLKVSTNIKTNTRKSPLTSVQ